VEKKLVTNGSVVERYDVMDAMQMVPQVGSVVVTVLTQVALETFLFLTFDRHVPPQVFDQSVRFATTLTLVTYR